MLHAGPSSCRFLVLLIAFPLTVWFCTRIMIALQAAHLSDYCTQQLLGGEKRPIEAIPLNTIINLGGTTKILNFALLGFHH